MYVMSCQSSLDSMYDGEKKLQQCEWIIELMNVMYVCMNEE